MTENCSIVFAQEQWKWYNRERLKTIIQTQKGDISRMNEEKAEISTHTHEHHNHGEAGHTHEHSHGHPHHHVHSQDEKKAVINRLSKAIGHLESVKRMVERDEDCSEVLIQLAAVRSAINNTGKLVLKNHISHCIVEAVEEDDKEAINMLNQAIDKFLK